MKIPIILSIFGIGVIFGILFLDYDDSNKIIINDDEILEYDEIITVGTIHRDPSKMNIRYQPFAEYIAKELSNENTLYKGVAHTVPTEEDMVNAINNRQMSIYFDSPLIGMKVKEQSNLNPFLLSWKEGHKEYHTVFITSIDSDISYDDLYDHTMIFEDNQSTTGYLLPLTHLRNSGYVIDETSDSLVTVFSLDDENTPIWILEGKGDVGATSNLDFEDIPINIKEKLKIIESTESIPRQIVFVGNHVVYQDELKKVLLDMNNDPEAVKILKKISKTSQFSEINFENDLNPVIELLDSLK